MASVLYLLKLDQIRHLRRDIMLKNLTRFYQKCQCLFCIHMMHFLHGIHIIMDFQWFNDLAALQETGHFSLAARKSHISQPALSRRIKALEDWAGFSLVDRRSRPVRLTPAGEQILDVALSSFKRLADERNILQQSNSDGRSLCCSFCRPAFGGLAIFSRLAARL